MSSPFQAHRPLCQVLPSLSPGHASPCVPFEPLLSPLVTLQAPSPRPSTLLSNPLSCSPSPLHQGPAGVPPPSVSPPRVPRTFYHCQARSMHWPRASVTYLAPSLHDTLSPRPSSSAPLGFQGFRSSQSPLASLPPPLPPFYRSMGHPDTHLCTSFPFCLHQGSLGYDPQGHPSRGHLYAPILGPSLTSSPLRPSRASLNHSV